MSRLEWFTLSVMALVAAALFGFVAGRESAEDDARLHQAKVNQAAYAEWSKTNLRTIERERELRRTERAAYEKYYATQENRNRETDRLVADLRRDAVRLRVPVRRDPQACAVPGGSLAAGTGEEGHAELGADASVFLVGLLKRGDDAIAKHAEVVDRYDRLAAQCAAHGQEQEQEQDHAE